MFKESIISFKICDEFSEISLLPSVFQFHSFNTGNK